MYAYHSYIERETEREGEDWRGEKGKKKDSGKRKKQKKSVSKKPEGKREETRAKNGGNGFL